MDVEMLIDKYQLNDSEAQVLRLMAQKRGVLKQMGIRDVAKEGFISTATIINMAKKIGFSGYSELVFALENAYAYPAAPHSFTPEQEQQFITLMKKFKDKRMMVLGSGFSQNLANYFSEYLNLYGLRATANSHLEYLRENQEEEILLFIISNSGDTQRLTELATTACEHRLPLIAFVGNEQSKIGRLATLTISTETYAPQVTEAFAPKLFFGTALNQFELLMSSALKEIYR